MHELTRSIGYNRWVKEQVMYPDRDVDPSLASNDVDPMPAMNAMLRQLVTASQLPSVVAMTIFNRGLGAAGCSETQWKGFLADPGSDRFVEMTEAQFAHAVDQFARIGVHREGV